LSNLLLRTYCLLVPLFFILFPLSAFSDDKMIPVIIDSDEITYLQQEGQVVARGNVVMKYKEVTLYCQEAYYNANTNIAEIKGDAKIEKDKTTLYGKDFIYDFNTYNAKAEEIRISDPPIYGASKTGSKLGKDEYILKNGYATTCDLEKPHYRLTAKKVVVYPGEKVVARNMVFKVGNFPLAFFPYFSQSLKDKSFLAQVVPGKDKHWGYYLLTRWRYNINPENRGNVILDFYEERGKALGLLHKTESGKFGQALFNIYGLHDELYEEENREQFLDEYPERSGISHKYLEDDRYKAQFSYSVNPMENLSIKSEFHKFSDEYFMKDFFEREYDIEPHPLSYTLANYSLSGSSLSLLAQKRANVFWSETEYQPQLEYDFFEKKIGDSNFYFNSSDNLGNLSKQYANSRIGDDAFRMHSHNTLSYSDNIRWLTINPYIGSYSTLYSRNKFGDDNTLREAFASGIALNTKLYKFFDPDWNTMGITVDKLRHVLTPEVSFSYLHDPTISSGNLYSFDEDDSLTREEKVIFTLKNKLQAKNSKKTWDFLYFSPAVEYRIDEEAKGSYFDNITADFEFYPKENFSLSSDAKYNILTRRFSEVNADFTVEGKTKAFKDGKEVESEKYSFSYGHRYTHLSSTQGTSNFYYHLTPKLRYNNYLRCEYNTGDIKEQQHTIRVDLHCWWFDFGVRIDKQVTGIKDHTFWVMFTLKAFPDVKVDFDRGYKGVKREY
jgi:LPS-assembly protein